MRKRWIMLALSALLVVQSTQMAAPIYAEETVGAVSTAVQDNTIAGRVIYLEDGEGTEGIGAGTEKSPYQNIRTALEEAQNGDTIKLVGNVCYTKYQKDEVGGAMPLTIDKAITIEGATAASRLIVRAPIQLGADVTMKGFHLELVMQVTLEGSGTSTGVLGQKIEKSNTIYLAGHKLTLDNVDTTLGSSQDQYNDRPWICGGTYKGRGEVGEKAVLTVVNPNGETKLGGIQAGDYTVNRNMNVEINLDGKLIDTTIYTGGDKGILTGDVQINIFGKSNVTNFNKANHNGKVNVTFMNRYFSASLNMTGIDTLRMTEGTRLNLPDTAAFDVQDVILENGAVIDFRSMKDSPSVSGNFTGVNTSDFAQCGTVIIGNHQTLTIGGQVTGLTKLNSRTDEYIPRFLSGHTYVIADASSTGNFTIEGTSYTNFDFTKSTEGQTLKWITTLKEKSEGEKFAKFEWAGGSDKIVKPAEQSKYNYPIVFTNKNGQIYKPDMDELLDDFSISLVRKDGIELDMEWEIFTDWDDEKMSGNIDEPNQIQLYFVRNTIEYGDVILTVTHNETGEILERTISIRQEEEEETPILTPSANPEPSENPTPSANPEPSVTPTPSVQPSVTPKVTLNLKTATIYTTGKTTTAQLKAKVVGNSKTVTYTSNKKSVATVDKTGKITAVAAGTAIITAKANGVTATCKVTVKKPSLKLNKTKLTLYTAGTKTEKLTAKVANGESKKVIYKSSKSTVAKIDQTGKITALKAGTATITAKANGVTVKCTVTVKAPTLTVSKSKITVKVGKTVSLGAKATPAKTISYASSKKQCATVTSTGKVKGVKPGTSIITVRCNGITKKVTVVVKK